MTERRFPMARKEANGRRAATTMPDNMPGPCIGLIFAVLVLVVIVAVTMVGAVDETLACAGEKLQVAFAGRPVQASDTLPVKLFTGTTLS